MNQLVRNNERHALPVGYCGSVGVDEESGFAVGYQPPIFHRAGGEVWDGDQVALADGILKVENLGK
jgi:hypothetical protein